MSSAVGAYWAAVDMDGEHGVSAERAQGLAVRVKTSYLIGLTSTEISRLLDEQLVALGALRGAARICRRWDERTPSASADAETR